MNNLPQQLSLGIVFQIVGHSRQQQLIITTRLSPHIHLQSIPEHTRGLQHNFCDNILS